MRKKLFVIMAFSAILIAYIFGIIYFYDRFNPGTFINGKYVTGMTKKEVEAELIAMLKPGKIIVRAGTEVTFDEKDYIYDISFDLDNYLGNCFLWPFFVTSSRENITPAFSINDEKLRNDYYASEVVESEKALPRYAKVLATEEGYELENYLCHHLDVDSLFDRLCDELNSEDFDITRNLVIEALASDYYDLSPDGASLYEIKKFEVISKYLENKIIYNLECENIELTDSELLSFVSDKDGNLLYFGGTLLCNKAKISDYVDTLCDKLNTFGNQKSFINHEGVLKEIKYETYGSLVEWELEYQFLWNAVRCCISGIYSSLPHSPVWLERQAYKGAYDIGDTFIEIDISNQILLFKKDGEYIFETPMVSGDVRRNRETPKGVYYLYNMEEDRVLVGADYRTPVDYWMPIYKGVGIHDASWRKAFGEEIYINNGSHGCLNIPLEKAEELFGLLEVGIPAVVY